MMGAAASEQGGSAGMRESEGLAMTPEQLFEIEEKHRREKGALRSYLEWVGILPRDVQRTARSFKKGEVKVSVPVPATVMVAEVVRDGEGAVEIRAPEDLSAKKQQDLEKRIEEYDWKVRLIEVPELEKRWKRNAGGLELPISEELQERIVLYRARRDGLLQGSLGDSDKYQDPVIRLVRDRIPISLFYGVISMILIYGICIPLGIVKAIKHRTWLDNVSSIACLLYTSPSPRDVEESRMPSSA